MCSGVFENTERENNVSLSRFIHFQFHRLFQMTQMGKHCILQLVFKMLILPILVLLLLCHNPVEVWKVYIDAETD